MTARTEVEITCDGNEGDGPFDCPTASVWGATAAHARTSAYGLGWTTWRRGRKKVDVCPDHKPKGGKLLGGSS